MIEDLFQLGDVAQHRGIVVIPIFPRRDPAASYITLDEALPSGFRVREVSDVGSVPELLVDNPLGQDVLLYDGEELVGAKQNRILNVSVLVAASSTLSVPVSCVEEGRWEADSDEFVPAAHASNPRLRRRKVEVLRRAPLTLGLAQNAVWDEVADICYDIPYDSPTNAHADAFVTHRASLSELESEFPLQRGQCGAVFALGNDLCLDAVSRPEAFAHLWPKLRAGYLLDALSLLDRPAASVEIARGFVSAVASAVITRGPSVGRGQDLRLAGDGILGSGLELDSELLQLSAFTSDSSDPQRVGRIGSPSTRRTA